MSAKKLPAAACTPDPAGGVNDLRYWDGTRWTPQIRVARTYVTGPNHMAHLALTVLTCGLWAFVWILVAIDDRHRVRTVYSPGWSPLATDPSPSKTAARKPTPDGGRK